MNKLDIRNIHFTDFAYIFEQISPTVQPLIRHLQPGGNTRRKCRPGTLQLCPI